MSSKIVLYRVFLGSPLGLEERQCFRSCLHEFNETHAVDKGVVFHPVFSDQSSGSVTTGGQAWADIALDGCDLAVIYFAVNWGEMSCDEMPYSFADGTLKEMERSLELLPALDMPIRDVLILFDKLSAKDRKDPGPSVSKILDTQRALKRTKRGFRSVNGKKGFRAQLETQLLEWLNRHESEGGQIMKPPVPAYSGYRNKHIEHIPFPGEEALDQNSTLYKSLEEAGRLADAQAVDEAETIYRSLEQSEDSRSTYQFQNDYAKFLYRKGELDRAKEYFLRIDKRAGVRNDLGWRARAQANLAIINLGKGEVKPAIHCLEVSLAINGGLGHLVGMADNHRWLAVAYRRKGVLDRAKEDATKSVSLYKETNCAGKDCNAFLADAYAELGIINRIMGEYRDSRALYEEAIRLNEGLGHPKKSCLADYRDHLGTVERVTGDLAAARLQYDFAFENNESQHRRRGAADVLGHLALLDYYCNDIDGARDRINHAKKIDMDLDYDEGLAKHCAIESKIILRETFPDKKQRLEASKAAARESLRINQAIRSKEGQSYARYALASAEYLLGELEIARTDVEQALQCFSEIGAREGVAECKDLKARILSKIGQADAAEKLCNEGLDYCKESGARLMESSLLITYAYVKGGESPCRELLEKARRICEETGELAKRLDIDKMLIGSAECRH